MQELKPIHVKAEIVDGVEVAPAFDYYEREPVDKRIAELKAENERLNRELEHVKNGDCINTCDVVEKHVKEELKAKRALWMARALALSRFDVDKYIRTHMMSNYWNCGYEIFVLACMAMQNKIDKTKEILIEKAKEYK